MKEDAGRCREELLPRSERGAVECNSRQRLGVQVDVGGNGERHAAVVLSEVKVVEEETEVVAVRFRLSAAGG